MNAWNTVTASKRLLDIDFKFKERKVSAERLEFYNNVSLDSAVSF